MDDRTAELAENLALVRARIDSALTAAGRSDSVTLIAVTKTFPADDVRRLASLGITNVAENRDQEARSKHRECADLDLTWHMIGQLQSNKASSVTSWADVVQSVDRVKLVHALDRAAGAELDVLIQVNLDDPPRTDRGGVHPDALNDLVHEVTTSQHLRLKGLMAVAPHDERAPEAFERLHELSGGVRAICPDATWISAGMSGDLEAAIAHGATHVRLGGAILGSRHLVQ